MLLRERKLNSLIIRMITLPVLTFMLLSSAHALDEVRVFSYRKPGDEREQYNLQVYRTALGLTIAEFGEYKLNITNQKMPLSRLRPMVHEGKIVNAAVAVTNSEWEASAIPIRIPIRRGILNYRMLMTTKDKLPALSKVKTLEQIKQMWGCVGAHWSTWHTMTQLNFNIVTALEEDSVIRMLSKRRCDYIPRGAHEIYWELESLHGNRKNLAVEPNLVLYMPAPIYIFVSPNEPRLAKRFALGLERMVELKILHKMVDKFYSDYIERANLKERTLIHVGNPALTPQTPFDKKELWFSP